jgi:replicative DNA helicase
MPTAPRYTQGRQVPLFDLALELGALGAAMLVPAQAAILIRDAHPLLFTTSFHRDIFEAIRSLGPERLDYTLLVSEMEGQGHHVAWDVLAHFDDGVVPEIPMSFRIERLKELYRRRCLASLAEDLMAWVYAPFASSSEIIRRIHAILRDVAK